MCVCVCVVVVVCVCLSPSLPASAIMRPSVYVSGSVCACLRRVLSVCLAESLCLSLVSVSACVCVSVRPSVWPCLCLPVCVCISFSLCLSGSRAQSRRPKHPRILTVAQSDSTGARHLWQNGCSSSIFFQLTSPRSLSPSRPFQSKLRCLKSAW